MWLLLYYGYICPYMAIYMIIYAVHAYILYFRYLDLYFGVFGCLVFGYLDVCFWCLDLIFWFLDLFFVCILVGCDYGLRSRGPGTRAQGPGPGDPRARVACGRPRPAPPQEDVKHLALCTGVYRPVLKT